MSVATEITRLQTAKADIKTAIEEKGVTVGDGTIDTYAEKIAEISSGGQGSYDEVYEAGKKTIIDGIDGLYRFFTNGQNMGLLPYVLNKDWKNKEINMQYTFQDNKVITDFIAPKTLKTKMPHGLFSGCTNLKTVTGLDEMINGIVLTGLFNGCNSLTNAGTINFEGVSYARSTFQGCSALVDIQIAGTIALSLDFKDSTLLSKLSITSIVNALSKTVGDTLALSKQAVINAFGSENAPEWTTLIADKSNWTIALL